MRTLWSTFLLSALLSSMMTACMTASYSVTSDVVLAARKPNCRFRIAANLPSTERYDEIGLISLTPLAFGNLPVHTVDDLRDVIQEDVCKAGGQLVVISSINGQGYYTSAVVYHKHRE